MLMADANQVWDVGEAIEWMRHLEPFGLRWIEEPTSPDDVLGHAAIRRAVAPVGVATGEHAANRVVFKQLLQADAIDYCQIDACRLGGVNEVLAVLLLAAEFGVPVCPHAGGLGLCEYVQHLAVIDYVCVSGSLDDRTAEFADHLHEHFVNPAVIRDARYVMPAAPGYSIDMHPESYAELAYPGRWRVATVIPAARRPLGARGPAVTGLGLGCAPIGNMFAAVSDDDARATVDAAWERRDPLLRHRAALRPRHLGTPARSGARRATPRRLRAVDQGGPAAAPSRASHAAADDLHRRRRARPALRLLARRRAALDRRQPCPAGHRPHRRRARARSRRP